MRLRIHKFLIFLFLLPILLCSEEKQDHLIYGIPSESDLLLNRQGFALGYSQKYKQAVWVSYILESEQLRRKQVRRKNKFRADPAIQKKPVKPGDYIKTGYDRGHLAPAADMTWSEQTEKESFYMSNISPQIPGCNRGIWKRLETQVRKWAIREEKICVITGPIFPADHKEMGSTKIAVPIAFYKVILDLTPPRKMIAFIIPNEPSKRRIQSFIVPVDKVESITGHHFFSALSGNPDYEFKKKSDFKDWK